MSTNTNEKQEDQVLKNAKKELREKVLLKRDSLTREEIEQKSRLILDKVHNLKSFGESNVIMSYVSFRSEVNTRMFINHCLELGKRVLVPAVVKKTGTGCKEIIASEISDPDKDLAIGTYGILEPRKESLREINPYEIDFMVVPGTVFDKNCNRIGYGAGYYDRFMKKVKPECFKVGLAFQLQMVDELPSEEHDVPLDMVITERDVYLKRGFTL